MGPNVHLFARPLGKTSGNVSSWGASNFSGSFCSLVGSWSSRASEPREMAARPSFGGLLIIVIGIAIGGGAGAYTARKIAMTAMPQLVAAFHSLVGLAAVAVAAAALYAPESIGIGTVGHIHAQALVEMSIGVAIGAITFTGSIIAFLKLDGRMSGKPILLPSRHIINIALGVALLLLLNVWLVARRSMWNYAFGIAAVSIYALVFWEARLYAAFALQFLFLALNLYGLWNWRRAQAESGELPVLRMSRPERWATAAGIVLMAVGIGLLLARTTDAASPASGTAQPSVAVGRSQPDSQRHVGPILTGSHASPTGGAVCSSVSRRERSTQLTPR